MAVGGRNEKRLISDFRTVLSSLLPAGWSIRFGKSASRSGAADFLLTLTAPSGESLVR